MKHLTASSAIAMLSLAATQAVAQSETGALEEIVVTAQRRQQNLQEVPIAITAMTGAMLAETGVRDPRDLQTYVPNLQFQSGTAATTSIIFLRGVGIGDFNANTTGAVGVYVDDVFLGANSGKLFNVFDGESVEVLRGPQGTLYGRNTTGGAIKFASRKPTDQLSADASVLYGRYNEVRLEGGIGGPLVADTLKVRISGLYDNRDGWLHNRVTGHDLNDVDLWAARAIVDFTPTDSLLLRLTVHGGNNNGGARQFQHRGQGVDLNGDPLPPGPCGLPMDGLGYSDCDHNPNAGDYNIEGKEKVDVFGGSLLGEFNLNQVRLTSITAYEEVNRDTLEDTDASPNDILIGVYKDKPRQWSEELRAQSDGNDRLSWIVGAFYFHDDLSTDSSYDVLRSLRPLFVTEDNPTGFAPPNIGFLRYPWTQNTESGALFGQADFKIGEQMTLTTGLRYTHDSIDFKYSSYFDELGGPYCVVPYSEVPGSCGQLKDSKSFSNVSGRLALSYQASDDMLFYGSISSGYNSGGFPGAAETTELQLKPFDSENLYAYEIGFKSEFMDRRVRFNAAAYYYDYRDLQVFIYDTSGAIPIQRKTNAGSAEIYGLEADLTWKPTSRFDTFLSMSLLHSAYQNFSDGLGHDFSGNKLVNAPEFAATAGITYTQPLGDAGSLRAMVDGSYQSQIYFTPANDRLYGQGSFTILNARLAWTPASQGFEVALWGKNLTDKRWVNFIAPVITMDQLNYNDPETYGVEFSYHTK